MADQVDRLILEDLASANLEKIRKALEDEERELRTLNQELLAGKVAQNVYGQEAQASAQKILGLKDQLKAAETAQRQTSAASGGLNQSLVQVTYAVNDLDQANVGWLQATRALSNNVPGLVAAGQNLASVGIAGITTALLSPAGLVVGLTAVASLAPLVVNHWSDLEDAFGLGGTKSEADRMAELGRQTKLTADETARLNQYKKEQAQLERLREAEPEAVKQARSAAEAAVGEFPGGLRGAAEQLQRAREVRNPGGLTGRLSDEEVQEAYRKGLTGPSGVAYQGEEFNRRKAEIDKKLLARARDREIEAAESDINEATLNPQAKARLLDELRRSPGLEGLADQLQTGTTAKGATKQEEEDFATQKAALELQAADEKKRLDEAQKDQEIWFNLHKAVREVEQADQKQRLEEAKKAYDEDAALQKAIHEVEEGDRKKKLEEAKDQGADIVAKAGAQAGGNAKQISQLLQMRHLDKATADALAEDAVKGEGRSQLEKLFGGEKSRSSVVLGGGAALSEAIQTSVGAGGEDQKQTRLLERIEGHFAALRQQPPGQRDFVFRR